MPWITTKEEMIQVAMKSDKPEMRVMAYSEMILDIVDNRDEFTRGDLQGAIEAVCMKIIKNEKGGK